MASSRIPRGQDGKLRHAVTVDGVLLERGGVLLVQRGRAPFKGLLALPGGFVEGTESAEAGVVREIEEETGLKTRVAGLVGVYSEPGRDPRGPTCTVLYLLDRVGGSLRAGDDAAQARFVALTQARRGHLAFDHDRLLADALLFAKALAPVLKRGVPSRVTGESQTRQTSHPRRATTRARR